MLHSSPWRHAPLWLVLCLGLAFTTACTEEWDKLTSSGGGGSDKDKNDETARVSENTGSNENSEGADQEQPSQPVVRLDPNRAELRGAAQYKCWGDCHWVVWCGHQICDGSWTWSFPSSGSYAITMERVKEKCAGSAKYEVRINGRTATSGRIPRYGSCGGCDGSGRWVDRTLGTFQIEAGDQVTLWAENDFACGIDGPGAYAAHDALRAELR